MLVRVHSSRTLHLRIVLLKQTQKLFLQDGICEITNIVHRGSQGFVVRSGVRARFKQDLDRIAITSLNSTMQRCRAFIVAWIDLDAGSEQYLDGIALIALNSAMQRCRAFIVPWIDLGALSDQTLNDTRGASGQMECGVPVFVKGVDQIPTWDSTQ